MDTVAAATRSPAFRLFVTILVALAFTIPLLSVWVLVYDRQEQSNVAQSSIAQGWGGPQVVSGPLLVIPYRTTSTETDTVNGQPLTRTVERWETRVLSPEIVQLDTELRPERRSRSIYEAIVYDAAFQGRARFALPRDIQRYGIDPARLDLARAELRFGLSDPRGLGANPRVTAGGNQLPLHPGGGTAQNRSPGFFAWLDAAALAGGPIEIAFQFDLRGNRSLALAPQAGDTSWRVRSSWPHPSFGGGFLPAARDVGAQGFTATYRVGNLALGHNLIGSEVPPPPPPASGEPAAYDRAGPAGEAGRHQSAQIDLIQPVDLYDQVNRATKYGFLFIGFTFLAFLMFDIVGGVRVSGVEYLLVGAGLILFFVMLLAFAEVIGFTLAYLVAAAAITGLIAFYSAAVLKSRRRAMLVAGLLVALYATLYLLLSLEAYSLLIGSLLLFAALAATMYLTRNLNWGARIEEEVGAAQPDV
ncbi:cell envelope integrity protein CreD [Sphingosinicella sp. YJ22]|uniref:cell envelope integrity protein CreD n=1 Tax=Sphingosinicella sp. YJ22 TaxID=1104780 RepID=UPI00140A54D1|nr:cell envelope integrity protein CreD [Sphingosinicella sp. YJ22]